MLLPHYFSSLELIHFLLSLHFSLHVLLLILLFDLLKQVILQLDILFPSLEVIPLQDVVYFVISLLDILLKYIVQFLVINLMELAKIGLFLDIFSVLLSDLLLSCNTEMHPLHVVILVLQEWRDG